VAESNVKAHVEFYVGTRDGERIEIVCDCIIGRMHSYDEWVEVYKMPFEQLSAQFAGRAAVHSLA
jgi:hypothetical protein